MWAKIDQPAFFQFLFLIRTSWNWNIKQINIVITLLFGLLNKIIYIKQYHGFVPDILVCQLKQVLYSLNQASQVWYSIIQDFSQGKKVYNHRVWPEYIYLY